MKLSASGDSRARCWMSDTAARAAGITVQSGGWRCRVVDGVDQVVAELLGAAEGLRVADTRLSEAISFTEGARRRVAGQGFRGVAANMGRIDHDLATNQSAISALRGQIDRLQAVASGLDTRSSPEQILAALAPLIQQFQQARSAALRLANGQLPATQGTARRVLSGGQPEHICARVQRVASVVQAVERRLTAACDAAERAVATARAAGEVDRTAASSGGGGSIPPGQSPGTPAGSTGPEPVGPDAPVPSFVQRIAETFQHVGSGSRQTVGYLADRDGTPLHDGRILSGTDGPARGGPGLAPDHPIRRWDVVERHVEGHAAALMRRSGAPREAVLVVSRRPCRGNRGCEWALPRILPDQSVLHVYLATPGHGARYYNSYPGSGRAVAP